MYRTLTKVYHRFKPNTCQLFQSHVASRYYFCLFCSFALSCQWYSRVSSITMFLSSRVLNTFGNVTVPRGLWATWSFNGCGCLKWVSSHNFVPKTWRFATPHITWGVRDFGGRWVVQSIECSTSFSGFTPDNPCLRYLWAMIYLQCTHKTSIKHEPK